MVLLYKRPFNLRSPRVGSTSVATLAGETVNLAATPTYAAAPTYPHSPICGLSQPHNIPRGQSSARHSSEKCARWAELDVLKCVISCRSLSFEMS
eukprot:s278_g48.t1